MNFVVFPCSPPPKKKKRDAEGNCHVITSFLKIFQVMMIKQNQKHNYTFFIAWIFTVFQKHPKSHTRPGLGKPSVHIKNLDQSCSTNGTSEKSVDFANHSNLSSDDRSVTEYEAPKSISALIPSNLKIHDNS